MNIDSNLSVNLITWVAALLPIIILLVLMIWLRWSTSAAAPVALLSAVIVAIFLYKTPIQTIAVAAGKGIWDAIFILYVIWPALILYHIADKAGSFKSLQQGLRNLIPDRLLTMLTFAWILPSFIQSIAGFGTPIAVAAPLLVGIGVKPIYAVALPMIGAAWANMFGSLATTWLATLSVVDIPNQHSTLVYTSALTWIPNLTGGIAIAWMYGKTWALRRGAPAIIAITLVHGGLQLLLVPIVPTVGNFFAASSAFLVLIALNKWKYYHRVDNDEPQRIFTQKGIEMFKNANKETAKGEKPKMSLSVAFAPYAILAMLAIVMLLISPVRNTLEQIKVGLPFPSTSTQYLNITKEATNSYSAFTPLTHPGTLLLLSAIAGYFIFKKKNFYGKQDSVRKIISKAAGDALPATTAITGLLLISKVMDHSGEITILAHGVAQVAPDAVFLAASNLIGILGALITSSNTASNVLFSPLQVTAAEAQGLPVDLTIAAQSAGGATGNAMAPGDALLGAAVVGIPEKLGLILRKTLPWSVITGILISLGTLVIYWYIT